MPASHAKTMERTGAAGAVPATPSVGPAPAVVAVSIGEGANHVLRLSIAIAAALIALTAVVLSRLRAARVDEEARLEREVPLRA